jgi:hypothetical protein
MVSNSLTCFGSAIQERLVAAVHRLAADGYDSTGDDSGSSDVATCRQTVEALLAPLSTAWQRMATGKETKEGPNRCQAPGAARTCLRRLRQWSTASPVAAPPRDLRACDHRLGFTCCPPPPTWGFRTGNSGQRGSRGRCREVPASARAGTPTRNTRHRSPNCRHGSRGTSPLLGPRYR